MCKFCFCVGMLILGALVIGDGCGSSRTEQPQPPRQSSPPLATQEETSQARKKPTEAEIMAAGGHVEDLQALTAEDRVAAKKQRICPVTGALLGSMGEPYKIDVKGQTVFLCCQGCAGAILQDPDKYLKELDEASAKDK